MEKQKKPRVKSPETYQKEQEYIKKNYMWVNVQFRRDSAEDAALYAHIEEQPESKAAYIKRLISQDMQKGDKQ